MSPSNYLIARNISIIYDALRYAKDSIDECINLAIDEFIDGIHIADQLGMPYEIMYKTLVTVGKSKNCYTFVIPVAEEIDFKKAARVVGEKALEMLPLKDLTAVTGYIRGGCTSIGMKKKFRTVIQEDAMLYEKVVVSGGRIGLQLILNPDDLLKAAEAEFADVIVSK